MSKISIIDYGVGNLKSLYNFIKKFEQNVIITSNKLEIYSSSLIILPGVGAFASVIKTLKDRKLEKIITKLADDRVPIVGICAGMQILASSSNEFGKSEGLNLIEGEINQMNNFNIGWRKIKKIKKQSAIIFNEENHFFFNHSYKFECNTKYKICISATEEEVNSIIIKDNIYGFQFHPEKSGIAGEELFENFLGEVL